MSKSGGKIWTIKVVIEGNEQRSLILYDVKNVIGEYLSIRRNYFDELLDSFNKSKNYNVGKGIEEIIGADGKDWTKNPWILLLAKDKEKGAPFYFLFKRETDLNGFLVAIGPELFQNYLKNNREDIENLRKLLEYIVSYNQKWDVTMLIPNFVN